MFRSILVPLDGTDFGEAALPLAVAVARRTGGALHLVHMHAAGGGAWSALEGLTPGVSTARPASREQDRAYLERTLAAVRERGVPGDVRLLEGPVGRSVAEWARDARVDLVVLATHARAGLDRLWHHDVIGHLSRHLSVPLLAVPDASGAVIRLEHVLAPTSAAVEDGADAVIGFCAAVGARLTLLRVVEPPMEVGYTLLGQDAHVNPYLQEDMDDAARRSLGEVAERARAAGVAVEVRVAHGANVPEAILQQAHDAGADLIALQTHGLGTLRHVLTSSTAEAVLHGATVPVLLSHREAEVEQQQAYQAGIGDRMGWRRAAPLRPAAPPAA